MDFDGQRQLIQGNHYSDPRRPRAGPATKPVSLVAGPCGVGRDLVDVGEHALAESLQCDRVQVTDCCTSANSTFVEIENVAV
jgi:hypothetical protein